MKSELSEQNMPVASQGLLYAIVGVQNGWCQWQQRVCG